ncbi:unnamed protein product [Urochloa humidicola]
MATSRHPPCRQTPMNQHEHAEQAIINRSHSVDILKRVKEHLQQIGHRCCPRLSPPRISYRNEMDEK